MSRDGDTSAVRGWGPSIVAGLAVIAVVAIAVVAMLKVGGANDERVVTIATAAFGVLGGLAGSFFAVRVADRGVEQVAQQVKREERGQPPSRGGQT